LKKIKEKAGETVPGNRERQGKIGVRPRRQLNRRANALFLKIAGGRLPAYSALKHLGRSSGREYVTPLSAYPLGDGFVMAVLYGEAKNVDWVRNVMAAGQCVLKTRREEHVLERPEIIPASQAEAAYPPLLRFMYRSRGIHEFLWAHRRQS
jgi:deazaflavin-dependent oxidoreductase (nitroreductase family)